MRQVPNLSRMPPAHTVRLDARLIQGRGGQPGPATSRRPRPGAPGTPATRVM